MARRQCKAGIPLRYDFIIIGAGIVGVAACRELLLRRPDARVLLLEKEGGPGYHQTGHNSGVIHAGVYYAPGSLKADFCKRGVDATLNFCKKHNIRMSGPALGRPPKQTAENTQGLRDTKQQRRQDEIDRIPIEGKFGQGKRRFGLDLIMSKLPETSETTIAMIFIIMNLERWLKKLLFALFSCGWSARTQFLNVFWGDIPLRRPLLLFNEPSRPLQVFCQRA